MTLPSTLRLDRLELKNFRCFAGCKIELHPRLTVLVAENGRGKTAILDAIGIALGVFVNTIAGTRQSHGFHRTDVRMVRGDDGEMTAVLTAYGSVAGQQIRWSRTFNGTRTTTKGAASLRRATQGLRQWLDDYATDGQEQPPTLPIVALYGTGRLLSEHRLTEGNRAGYAASISRSSSSWSEHRLTEGKRTADSSTLERLAGYTDCLSSSSTFKPFMDWYEDMMAALRGRKALAYGPNERPERLLAAVREATRTVLEPTEWLDLDWDLKLEALVVEHPEHGRLPLSILSDGIRNMVALVADLAHRCVRLNPHFGESAARLTPGLLLIDEVDMHIHPRWQQLVVDLLQKAFPAMQMVLSTHSPHVLSTVDMGSIRVIRLRDGQGMLDTPTFQTRGVESADVLTAIMGVDPVPQVEEARWLSSYRGLIEDGKAEAPEALALRAKLVDHFGPQHPLILDCERLIRFQAFKLRRSAAGKQEG